jgi:hypothetical protein
MPQAPLEFNGLSLTNSNDTYGIKHVATGLPPNPKILATLSRQVTLSAFLVETTDHSLKAERSDTLDLHTVVSLPSGKCVTPFTRVTHLAPFSFQGVDRVISHPWQKNPGYVPDWVSAVLSPFEGMK